MDFHQSSPIRPSRLLVAPQHPVAAAASRHLVERRARKSCPVISGSYVVVIGCARFGTDAANT
jgi:hypothetical protein